MDIQAQKEMLNQLAIKHSSSQVENYKDSIFLPYITLTNAKGKGMMMEEFFEWYLNELGIETELKKSNENYDFLIRKKLKVELKVASIGVRDKVSFNQIHFGKDKEIDKFLFVIIKPNDTIDFFLVPKEDFVKGKIKVQKQHGKDTTQCARIFDTYNKIILSLASYRVDVDKLSANLI